MVPTANHNSLINLSQLPKANRYFVAYSGGMDSTALLHALILDAAIKDRITAIHINHNIDNNAHKWAEHCQSFCDRFGVNLITRSAILQDHSEDSCRKARQIIYADILDDTDCLITGHHLNDQAETVLFRLIRGTGLTGLTGMKTLNKQQQYTVFRPMLGTPQETIEQYIQDNRLDHVTDPSNANTEYSRNFIRNELLPLMRNKFPHAIKNIALTARNIDSSSQLLDVLLQNRNPYEIPEYCFQDQQLLASVLYSWLAHFCELRPNHRALNQFAHDCITASPGKIPHLRLSHIHLKYWRNCVYALIPRKEVVIDPISHQLINNQPFKLPMDCGSIQLLSDQDIQLDVDIKFQQHSEKILLENHRSRAKMKNLFRAEHIPPWERQVMPYVYINNELMAVGSTFKARKFNQLLKELNAQYQWLSPQLLL